MSLNFNQIWVSPLLQEAGGRGAHGSPMETAPRLLCHLGSTAGYHPGSVLLSSPHMAALVLGSWVVGPLTLPWQSPVSVLGVCVGVFGHR